MTVDTQQFAIPDDIQVKYPELVRLIIATESMDTNEKQYWFDMLPSMTNDQIDRLFNILETERVKLLELEQKYQEDIKALNEKHLIEWQDIQIRAAKEKIREQEAQDKEEDATIILNTL